MLALLIALVVEVSIPWGAAGHPTAAIGAPGSVCAEGSPYYAIELFTTRNVPGTGLAEGRAEVSLPATSPFPVAVTAEGSYAYDIRISLERVKPPRQGRLVAWVTTPEIDQVKRLGALDLDLEAAGTVDWNQFLVVVTLEADAAPEQAIWSGPVVFRGMSRSGLMHTMVGHGALEQENCAAYGFGN